MEADEGAEEEGSGGEQKETVADGGEQEVANELLAPILINKFIDRNKQM